jgi:hypothetical protein
MNVTAVIIVFVMPCCKLMECAVSDSPWFWRSCTGVRVLVQVSRNPGLEHSSTEFVRTFILRIDEIGTPRCSMMILDVQKYEDTKNEYTCSIW